MSTQPYISAGWVGVNMAFVRADEDPALHDLLDRVAHALDLRLAERHDDLPFDIERTVVIQEISHSMFRAAEHEHAPTVREARL